MKILPRPLAAIALFTLAAVLRAAEPVALTDLAAAQAVAAREHKQLILEFSGRTWCPPCKQLRAEVLSSDGFGAFAKDRVYVHLDYPKKSERTPEKIAADPALAKLMALKDAYKISGFPTVVLFDAAGKEIGRVEGYEPGLGPTHYLATLTGAK